MPRGDGTGPAGMGPMTGRAAGYCAGYPVPGFMNPIPGGGYGGWGRGYGRGGGAGQGGRGSRRSYGLYGPYGGGFVPPQPGYGPYGVPYGPPPGPVPNWGGYAYPAPPPPEQELGMLRDQAEYLEGALGDIRKRIEELEAETREE